MGRGTGAPGTTSHGRPQDGPGTTGRTWTVTLPAGLQIVTLNDRHHWRTRWRLGQVITDAATVMARAAKLPPLERVSIVGEYQPPDRRRRDPDNIMPAVKNAVDGIVRAGGILPDDSAAYIASVTCEIGPVYPRGRLVLYVTEFATVAGAA